MKQFLLTLSFFALTISARADFYWLVSGVLQNNAGSRSDKNGNGLGCWLELTNDVDGVEYNPVHVYDIRRKTTGGTDIVKYGDANNAEMFPGCRYGEADVDLTLPIRDADGTEYHLVEITQNGFGGNLFIGTLVLGGTINTIGNQAFRNCYFLQSVTIADPDTWAPTSITRAFEGCNRLESVIVWPDALDTLTEFTFSGDGLLKGFSGKSIKTYANGCFQSVGTNFRLEMSEADTISFTGQVINNNAISTVIWHETPPSTGDYFSKTGKHFMSYSKTSRVHYIPYDATQEGGIPARWAAYKPAFEAETSGNSLTFPVFDPETGVQTDGSWYVNGRAADADKVRFWFPEAQAALLMK